MGPERRALRAPVESQDQEDNRDNKDLEASQGRWDLLDQRALQAGVVSLDREESLV